MSKVVVCFWVRNIGRALELQRALSFVPIQHTRCSTTFHGDLLPPHLNPYHILFAIVAVFLAVSQLEVTLLVSLLGCVASWTHTSSTHLVLVRLDRTCCAAFAATAVSPSDGWLEEVARPVALPFGGGELT